MTQLRIKNWEKFQHFKDRRPPWIKLYRDILDDKEWHKLDPAAAKLLVMIWLIASEDDGVVPDLETLAFRLRMQETDVSQLLNKLNHWLYQSDINATSTEYQNDGLERETERETEEEGAPKATPIARADRATRIPEDFALTAERRLVAEAETLPADRTFAKFVAYWKGASGAKARKVDWDATWRNWCMNEKDNRKGGFQKTEADGQRSREFGT